MKIELQVRGPMFWLLFYAFSAGAAISVTWRDRKQINK